MQLLNLRNLTRQHESMTGQFVQIKLQFQAVLDQVFPEFKGVYGALYAAVSLKSLLEFPTSEALLSAGEAKLAERIAVICACRSEKWAKEKAQILMAADFETHFAKRHIRVICLV